MNYEKDIIIDETALDIEWLEQAKLFMKYSKYLAEKQMELDKAKEALDIVMAELDLDMRNNPDDYDIPKVTEGSIKSSILQNVDYKAANETYLQLKFEVNIARSAVSAFEQRKTALENLVKLHGQQYFAGPKVPRDLTEERQLRQKETNAKIKIRRRS